MHESRENRFSLISVREIFPWKNIWIYESSNCKIKMFRTPFGAFPTKLLFASCGAPLIKDIKQNGNCIIGVFLKWRLIAPNSFTLIMPQHWKWTLDRFLVLQHSDSTVSWIVSTSTPSSFLLPSTPTAPANTDGHWCMWEKESWIFWRSPGWMSASTTPALPVGPQEVQIHISWHTPSHVCMSCHTADIYVSTWRNLL